MRFVGFARYNPPHMSVRIRTTYFLLLGIVIGAVFFTTLSVLVAWTGPESAPPNGNVSPPINTGAMDQVKDGGIALNALAVFGNAILAGTARYLNFGATAGESGYGIRDNNGTIEFRHSGGTWQPLSAVATQPLYNGVHTSTKCQAAGGLTRSAGSSLVCEFTASSCPSGWTRLNNWGSTAPRTCSSVGSCTTSSHAFSNRAAETCTYCTAQSWMGTSGGGYQCSASATCAATQQTVGCY